MNRSFSSQEDASSYLDLKSAMMQNEEREKLLQRMVEQQVELKQLQERQKALLDAQQQVSKLDFISTHDLQEKLERLQAVKHRIATLQSILDDAEASSEVPNSPALIRSSDGAGDSNEQKEDLANASALVNDQLEDLYVTVTNLLSDIDKMNLMNEMADKQQRAALENAKPQVAQARALPSTLDKSHSPLPSVKLVDSNPTLSKHNLSQSSDGADVSLVERHYYASNRSQLQVRSPSESSFDESIAMKKPVHELWQEMRRYQSQLEELQQRRRELTSYLKANEEMNLAQVKYDEQKDESGNTRQSQVVATVGQCRKTSDAKPSIFPSMKYYMGEIKATDASTERTNATWGGSTSTSGDESEGSILQPATTDTTVDATRRSSLSQLPDYVEEAVYKLWKQLDYHNSYLQLLLNDQKALSVLLENTLSMQKDHQSTVMYGISPDFLIYQLDNCSAQIMVYRKQIVMLHKDLLEIQKQYPGVDISYGFGKSVVQKQSSWTPHKFETFDDMGEFSPRNFSQKSTPMKYYTTASMRKQSPNDSFDKVYQPFQRSPASYPAKQNESFKSFQVLAASTKVEQKSPQQMKAFDKGPTYVTVTNAPKLNQPVASTGMYSTANRATANKATLTSPVARFQTSREEAKPEISDVDSNASGYPLFEALRNTIYSEAASLITQNEARPHFLIELFHELQQLNSDYLRQHCLFVIRDVVNGYIVDTPKGVDGASRKQKVGANALDKSKSVYTDFISSMKPAYSENTPSESEAESETPQFGQPSKAQLQYDFALDVSNASIMTTPMSSQEYQGSGDNNVPNPFGTDFLGSTVIHLDEALQRVREMERLKLEEAGKVIDPNKEEKQDDGKPAAAQLDAQKLDLKIKEIINEVIPIIKSTNEVCSEEKIKEISSLVAKLVTDARLAVPKTANGAEENPERALQAILTQCLNKFLGYHLNECGEEIVLDVSEVLFNELAYIYMIDDYEVLDEDQNKVDEAIIQNMVEEECSTAEQDDSQSVTTDMNDVSSTSSYTSSNSDSKEDENSTVTQMKQDATVEAVTGSGDGSVIFDLSVSETKPLTSYGSGEDEEAGSGEEYDQYNECEDVPTSMQNDKLTAAVEKKEVKNENGLAVNGVKETEEV